MCCHKHIAYKRALGFYWHLMNETSFKGEIDKIKGPGPYMRLVNMAREVGIDPIKAQLLTRGEWIGVVDRAIRSKAQEEKTREARSKGVPSPTHQFFPRSYIRLGGGAAKHGVQFRWNLCKQDYADLKGSRIGLPEETTPAEDEEMPCDECENIHSNGSTSAEDLACCGKACDKQVRIRRRKALCAIAEENHGKHLRRAPRWTIPALRSIEWKNQSRGCTIQVLLLMKAILKEIKYNESVRNRINRFGE